MTAIRLSGDPCGPGDFTVPSRTFPGEAWTVTWVGESTHWCPCPAHHRKNTCRHVAAVALAIEVEARQAVTPERRALAAARLATIAKEFDCD